MKARMMARDVPKKGQSRGPGPEHQGSWLPDGHLGTEDNLALSYSWQDKTDCPKGPKVAQLSGAYNPLGAFLMQEKGAPESIGAWGQGTLSVKDQREQEGLDTLSLPVRLLGVQDLLRAQSPAP